MQLAQWGSENSPRFLQCSMAIGSWKLLGCAVNMRVAIAFVWLWLSLVTCSQWGKLRRDKKLLHSASWKFMCKQLPKKLTHFDFHWRLIMNLMLSKICLLLYLSRWGWNLKSLGPANKIGRLLQDRGNVFECCSMANAVLEKWSSGGWYSWTYCQSSGPPDTAQNVRDLVTPGIAN